MLLLVASCVDSSRVAEQEQRIAQQQAELDAQAQRISELEAALTAATSTTTTMEPPSTTTTTVDPLVAEQQVCVKTRATLREIQRDVEAILDRRNTLMDTWNDYIRGTNATFDTMQAAADARVMAADLGRLSYQIEAFSVPPQLTEFATDLYLYITTIQEELVLDASAATSPRGSAIQNDLLEQAAVAFLAWQEYGDRLGLPRC